MERQVQSATEKDVQIGIANIVGEFSLVDTQQFSPGHGVVPAFDGSRSSLPVEIHEGRRSFVFGQGTARTASTQTFRVRGYDYPGGAHGTLVSNEFDLSGYSSADKPVLYFNYFADTENKDFIGLGVDPFARDSFRVFIADNTGDWQLLATNEADVSLYDEQPLFDFPTNQLTLTPGAQWRQVRIDLDEHAGRDHLRLRFDFSTAGTMNVGESTTTGTELRAVAGIYINDGDTLTIDGQIVEFDSGLTLVTPSGAGIGDQETISITDRDGNSVTFEFVIEGDPPLIPSGDPQILVASQLNAAELAQQIVQAIQLTSLNLVPHHHGNRINLEGAIDIQVSAGAAQQLTVEGDVGVSGDNIAAVIHRSMTRTEVADVVDQVFESLFFDPRMRTNDGSNFRDGDTFTIDDGVNAPTVFEFDSGFVLNVHPAGGAEQFGGMRDAEVFAIDDPNDGEPPLRFEFDKDHLSDPFGRPTVAFGNTAILIADLETASSIAKKVAQAVSNHPLAADLGLSPGCSRRWESPTERTRWRDIDAYSRWWAEPNCVRPRCRSRGSNCRPRDTCVGDPRSTKNSYPDSRRAGWNRGRGSVSDR